tara:strand:+ start:98 stop:631 length:534 start_codon:yes stop_codon:yes gene_type:complete
MIITGIGARATPDHICELFTELGIEARTRGWWVRSGHADGADYAFEKGATSNCIVYMPWSTFNKDKEVLGVPRTQQLRDEVLKIVYKHEKYAKDLSDGVKLIKSRNVYQVLGEDLKSPSDLVVCWTPYGEVTGGTGLAIKIATANNIPVINVGDFETEKSFNSLLREVVSNVEVNHG